MWWKSCDAVHCGFWINWENGTIKGSMLTLPREWGLVVGSFVALFVKLGGQHLWTSICFIIHQVNASLKEQDDMHHQYQLILRNTESESTVIRHLLKLGYAHKGARFEAYRRSFLLIILASAHGIGFYAAAVLSSRYISGSNEVQVLSRSCGTMDDPPLDNLADDAKFEAADAMLVMGRHGYQRSASYAKACYAQSSINSAACSSYVQSTLPYDIIRSVTCPFDEKVCNGSGIIIDTGYLRSDKHMGINTRPEDGISVRKTLTCVPLAGERYTDGWFPIPNELATSLQMPEGGFAKGYKFGTQPNATYLPQYTFTMDSFTLGFGDQPYNLRWTTSFINNIDAKSHPFDPIPELQSLDSDVHVISLLNRVMYRKAISDPWFSAQNRYDMDGEALVETYSASDSLSFIGCQERYQFCTADKTNCSPMTGLHGISPAPSDSPNLNPTQKAILALYWKMMWMSQLNFQLGLIGRENLIANAYLWDVGFGLGLSAPLPDNHWETEVQNWMNTTLAVLQRAASAWARPPEFDIGPGIPILKHIIPPQDPETLFLCHKVKARSPTHVSFSVLGLGLTLGLGLSLILLDSFLPKMVSLVQKRIGKGLHKRLEWIESSGFQLQRMAAEGRGIGPWEGREEDVPRLSEYGHVFNLTSESLKAMRSKVQSYESVGKGMEPEPQEIELGSLEGDGRPEQKRPDRRVDLEVAAEDERDRLLNT